VADSQNGILCLNGVIDSFHFVSTDSEVADKDKDDVTLHSLSASNKAAPASPSASPSSSPSSLTTKDTPPEVDDDTFLNGAGIYVVILAVIIVVVGVAYKWWMVTQAGKQRDHVRSLMRKGTVEMRDLASYDIMGSDVAAQL
jgi:hypothetical protein